jgi:predicted  nucleic acid-binding Zn-ribbon protein
MGGKRKYPSDYHNLAKVRNFEWLGPSVRRTNEKTSWKCTCGYIWEAVYNNIQQGKGCPSCGGSLPKTEKDYRYLAAQKGIEWIGETLPPNVKTKTSWQCSEGHRWDATHDSVHGSGQGCPDCGTEIRLKKKRLKDDQYHELAKEKGIKWLGPLPSNNHTKTWWECPKGHQWEASMVSVKQTRLCPICNNRYPKTAKDYHDLAHGKGFSWTAQQIPKSVFHKTDWQCSKGHSWKATHDSLTRNGCPVCNASKGETRVRQVLDSLGVNYQMQYSYQECKSDSGRLLHFDFFGILESGQSFLIEYDGEQHFKPIEFYGGEEGFLRRIELDGIKTNFAKQYCIPLLRISYVDFDSIKTILTEWLKNIECFGESNQISGIQLALPFND